MHDAELTRLFLSSTTQGDLTELIDYVFDSNSAGPWQDRTSYNRIMLASEVSQIENILFVCNYGQDVRAADEFGAQTLLLTRASTDGGQVPRSYYTLRFACASSMDEVEFIAR